MPEHALLQPGHDLEAHAGEHDDLGVRCGGPYHEQRGVGDGAADDPGLRPGRDVLVDQVSQDLGGPELARDRHGQQREPDPQRVQVRPEERDDATQHLAGRHVPDVLDVLAPLLVMPPHPGTVPDHPYRAR